MKIRTPPERGRNPRAEAPEAWYAPLVMSMPRDFYETMVKPSYWDWRGEPLAQHLAKATVGYANDMAERMFHHLKLEKVYQDRGPAQYRDALAEEYPDFGLLRDIADGTKHYRIGRPSRKISSAEQTGRGSLTWDKLGDKFEDADYSWEEAGDLLVVTLDNGGQRSLISIVNNVMSIWERLLSENGL